MHATALRRLILAFAALSTALLLPDRTITAQTAPRASLVGQFLIATPTMLDPSSLSDLDWISARR
jgi:hypothetical protein